MTDRPILKSFADLCRDMAEGLRSGQLTGGDLSYGATLLDRAAGEVERRDDARDIARFSKRMTNKMARKSYEGLTGWRIMEPAELWQRLSEQISRGPEADPIDVANYAMMLHEVTETRKVAAQRSADAVSVLSQ